MVYYPASGYIIFNLRKLKFYGGRGLDNPNIQIYQLFLYQYLIYINYQIDICQTTFYFNTD